MDKMSHRVLALTVGCMLLLSATAEQVIAWPCPPPAPDCHTCTPTGWEYDCVAGESCCDDTCCNTSTQKCCDDIGGDDDGYCCDPNDICCKGNCCNPILCEVCNSVTGQCESICNPDTQVCCDGVCTPKCEQVELNNCSTSMSWDCFPCQNLPWLCNNADEVVYTGNHPYNCWSGCPGDCHEVNDVHCYTKYKCAVDSTDYLAICEWVGPGDFDYACVDHLIGWTCYECGRDPTDEGEKHYTTSRKCE